MAVTTAQLKKFVKLVNSGHSILHSAEHCGFDMKDLGKPTVSVGPQNFVVWSFINIENKQSFLVEDHNLKMRLA